jgi:hypothetical protein
MFVNPNYLYDILAKLASKGVKGWHYDLHYKNDRIHAKVGKTTLLLSRRKSTCVLEVNEVITDEVPDAMASTLMADKIESLVAANNQDADPL